MTKIATGLGCALLIASAGLGGCASAGKLRHAFIMRGSVIAKQADKVSLCVGTEDGAKVGQTLSVYRYVSSGNPSKEPFRHKKVFVGKVRIERLFDGHFAVAKIVSGSVAVNHVVELR